MSAVGTVIFLIVSIIINSKLPSICLLPPLPCARSDWHGSCPAVGRNAPLQEPVPSNHRFAGTRRSRVGIMLLEALRGDGLGL